MTQPPEARAAQTVPLAYARVLGIAGGAMGAAAVVLVLLVASAVGGSVGTPEEWHGLLGWSAVTLACAVLGITGGVGAHARPRLAGAMMLVSAAGGVIASSVAYLPGAVALVTGGVLALVGQRRSAL